MSSNIPSLSLGSFYIDPTLHSGIFLSLECIYEDLSYVCLFAITATLDSVYFYFVPFWVD